VVESVATPRTVLVPRTLEAVDSSERERDVTEYNAMRQVKREAKSGRWAKRFVCCSKGRLQRREPKSSAGSQLIGAGRLIDRWDVGMAKEGGGCFNPKRRGPRKTTAGKEEEGAQ
jgi:hypothetical protein